jgi:hypothetical protein
MDYHHAEAERRLPKFRQDLEAEISGASCQLSKRGLEIDLPLTFRKQDHLGVFDRLVALWGTGFLPIAERNRAVLPAI